MTFPQEVISRYIASAAVRSLRYYLLPQNKRNETADAGMLTEITEMFLTFKEDN